MFVTSSRCLSIAALFALGCHEPPAPPNVTPPAPVTVAAAQVKTVPVQLRAIGTVRVFATVSVRPRVGGELTAVHFREGADVKKGDKLFTIDPRPYQTALEQAKAQLERNQALMRGAEMILTRNRALADSRTVTGEEMDRLRTEVSSFRAAATADQAAVKTAELQLSFTTVVSPIDGRTGSLLITPGNLVTANEAAPIVVINQIAPIAVAFSIPEQHLATIEASRRLRGDLPVEALLRDGSPPLQGALTFIDNSVDSTTGTVQLKATFANDDRRLWPGQFVDLVMTLSERPDSVTVPAVAVQEGQNGPYVFVVSDGKAELRPVQVALITGANEAVIASGLRAGESVVTDGQLRVAPGSRIAVKGAAAAEKQP